jgi:predicted DNA-binding transcriptional regulator YafY
MSKRAFLSRYILIIKIIKAKPYITLKEIERQLENKLGVLIEKDETMNVGLSKRTIGRDIKDIRNLFDIDIEYVKKQKGYIIHQNNMEDNYFDQMIEAVDIFNALNLAQNAAPFIHLEKRRPQGTEHLFGLLHAIKNKYQVGFVYQKFWEDKPSLRLVEPFALKEFKNRWYLMAKDNKDNRVKSFALDRLSNLDITNKPFESPIHYNIEENYKYCFGIINPDDEPPQDVVLSFEPTQGKYIKTLPLHHTQKVLVDNEDELRIQLKLCLTFDFTMELLSHGDNVKVLQPKVLVEEIKAAHEKAAGQYQL